MNTILFHQNVSYKVNDIFVIDGVMSESMGTPQQQEAMQLLHGSSRRVKKFWFPDNLKLNCSPVLEIYFGLNDVYIISQSNTQDEGGRFIPFEFYSASYTNPERTMDTLQDSIKKAGLQENEEDMKAIKWALNMIPFEKNIAIILISFIAFIILLFTIKNILS